MNQSSHDGKPLAELFQPFVPTHHDPPSLKKFSHIRLFMSVTDEKKTEKLWPIHPQAQDGTDDVSISMPVFLSSYCMTPIPFFEYIHEHGARRTPSQSPIHVGDNTVSLRRQFRPFRVERLSSESRKVFHDQRLVRACERARKRVRKFRGAETRD